MVFPETAGEGYGGCENTYQGRKDLIGSAENRESGFSWEKDKGKGKSFLQWGFTFFFTVKFKKA